MNCITATEPPGPGGFRGAGLRQDQVAPGDEQQPAPAAIPGRKFLPVLRTEAILDGGEEQSVL